ncbi:MAG: cupredoxin domain-containing protein [bacterium]|nr:cupredoxin domain-containing protein [bacterium]
MKNLLIAVAVVSVVALLGFFLLKGTGKKSSENGDTTTNSAQNNTQNPTQNENAGNTIAFVGGSFSPVEITVKSGDTVTIVNESAETIELDSDPHPIHTGNNELNVGSINPGETKTITLTKTGTWGYHNHLNSSQKGTIIVQ